MGALGMNPSGGGGGAAGGSAMNAVEEHGMPYVLVLALLLLSPASWRAHRRMLLQVSEITEISISARGKPFSFSPGNNNYTQQPPTEC